MKFAFISAEFSVTLKNNTGRGRTAALGKRYEVNYFGPGPIPQTKTPRTYPEPGSRLTHCAARHYVVTHQRSPHPHPQSLSRRNKTLEAHFFGGSESFTSMISFDASSSVKKVEGGGYRL